MPLTTEEKTAFDLNCYGAPRESVDAQLRLALQNHFRHDGTLNPGMALASMLSDCQELIAMGDKEAARKRINIVKKAIFDHLEITLKQ